MALLRAIVSHRWRWPTLVVLLGMLFLARLGVWQLDRLEQRRALNDTMARQLASAPLNLTAETTFPEDVKALRNRTAVAVGEFDLSRQLFLVQQRWRNELGGHLVVPLVLPGGEKAILVDRGWVPLSMSDPAAWDEFDVSGMVTVTGYLQPAQTLPGGRSIVPETPQTEWFRIDIAAIQHQMPYELLPLYLLQAPEEMAVAGGGMELPLREAPDLSLSEGSHLSYALQWFSFSLLLGVGYLALVYKSLQEEKEGYLESTHPSEQGS